MNDPFDESEDDNDYPEEMGFWDDDGRQSPLGPEGCCFPDKCCMAAVPHYESECHTVEMLMEQEREARRWEQVKKRGFTFSPILNSQNYGKTN